MKKSWHLSILLKQTIERPSVAGYKGHRCGYEGNTKYFGITLQAKLKRNEQVKKKVELGKKYGQSIG